MSYEKRLQDWLTQNAHSIGHLSPGMRGLCHILDEDRLAGIPRKQVMQPHEDSVFDKKLK